MKLITLIFCLIAFILLSTQISAQGNVLSFSHGMDRTANHGDTVNIPLIANGVENINSMQFTIHFNPHVMEFLSISDLDTMAGFSMNDIGTAEAIEGRIYFVFIDPVGMGASMNDGDTLMNVKLRLIGRPGSESMFGLQSFPVDLQAFGGGNFKDFRKSRIDVHCQEPQSVGYYHSVCSQGPGSDLSEFKLTVFGNTYPVNYLLRDTAEQDTLASLQINSDTVVTINGIPEDMYISQFSISDSVIYSDSLNVTEKEPLTAQFSTDDGSCPQIADGNIFLQEINGGLGAFTVIWPDGSLHYRSFLNVRPGFYDIVIIDANRCADTFEIEVEGPEAIIQEDIRNASCPSVSNGRLIADVLNLPRFPDSTLLFSLNGTNFYSDVNFKTVSLPPGSFRYYIQDTTGCIYEKETFILSENEIFVQGVTQSHPSCQGMEDGEISLIAALRTTVPGNFSFSWSGNNSTSNDSAFTATNLSEGVYELSITHSGLHQGCELVQEFTFEEPDSLIAIQDTVVHESCYQAADGHIAASAEGGSLPYEFEWSNGSTDQQISELTGGEYQLTITDRNGCMTVDTFSVDTGLQVTFSSLELNDVLCNGGSSGSISAQIDSTYGEPTPLFYKINPIMESSVEMHTDSFSVGDLSAGDYQILIQDSLGCGIDSSIRIEEPTPIEVVKTDSVIADCETNNGSLTVNASGGTGDNYKYTWSTGDDSSTINNIFSGQYSLSVEDANGCLHIDTVLLPFPTPPQLDYTTIVDVECHGDDDGFIALEVSEGSSPIEDIKWSTADTGLILSNLSAGIYSITVTDAKNCKLIRDFVVQEPDSITITFAVTPDSTGNGVGSATAIVNGGVPPYSFVWNTSPIQTDSIAEGLPVGNYQVLVRDENDCTVTATVEVPMSSSTEQALSQNISIYPNPSSGRVYLSLNGPSVNYPSLILIRSVNGQLIQSLKWDRGQRTQKVQIGSSGTYYIEVLYKDSNSRVQIPVVIQQ